MGEAQSPTVCRRRVRLALRKARETAALTQEQVAVEMDWSPSKVIRIESGTVSISTNDLRALLRLYGVTDDRETTQLLRLARTARQRAWWNEFRDAIPAMFVPYIGLETEACTLRCFQAESIPGLLQTEAYARAMISGTAPDEPGADRVEQLVAVRKLRQRKVLGRPDPPQIIAVLDESVTRRVVGSRAVLREQLAHLVQAARRPNITIRVLPFTAGPHPGMAAVFTILDFPDDADDPVLYVENAMTGDILDRPEEMGMYYRAFDKSTALALDPEASIALVEDVAAELA